MVKSHPSLTRLDEGERTHRGLAHRHGRQLLAGEKLIRRTEYSHEFEARQCPMKLSPNHRLHGWLEFNPADP